LAAMMVPLIVMDCKKATLKASMINWAAMKADHLEAN
jgi:hypothetical protein